MHAFRTYVSEGFVFGVEPESFCANNDSFQENHKYVRLGNFELLVGKSAWRIQWLLSEQRRLLRIVLRDPVELMGHSKAETTLEYYNQVDEDHEEKAARVVQELLERVDEPKENDAREDNDFRLRKICSSLGNCGLPFVTDYNNYNLRSIDKPSASPDRRASCQLMNFHLIYRL